MNSKMIIFKSGAISSISFATERVLLRISLQINPFMSFIFALFYMPCFMYSLLLLYVADTLDDMMVDNDIQSFMMQICNRFCNTIKIFKLVFEPLRLVSSLYVM